MTNGLVIGEDGLARCTWGGSTPDYAVYHDTEWGQPVRGDDALYERLCLEAFQSGLSWLTILRKRENFRAAFAGFVIEKVAAFDAADEERLLLDAGIVRNRAKIEASIANARAAAELPGGLSELLWSFAPPARPRPASMSDGAGDVARVGRAGQGPQEARLPVRRPDHGVRVDAGHRHGRRPPRRLPRPPDRLAPASASVSASALWATFSRP